ncbi:MAG TPA: hypothetical protein VNW26_05515 [Steroidobacteraceae bacterium]|jgi:hypothetical protein|nr:hypothetical protein [Steroidobacteraceae bacterium]
MNAINRSAHQGLRRAAIAALLLGAPLFAAAGTWQTLKNPPPLPEIIDPAGNDYGPGGASGPLLMTDGGVLIQNNGFSGEDATIWKLTPDINGSYINGTWSQLASKPFIAYAGAQAVLADGRIILEGGEYSNYGYDFLLTNQGAIYDPVSNTWISVPPPLFFNDLYPPRAVFAPHPIGDSASIVLADGTFMLADKMSHQAALLDLKTLTWTETGTATKADLNDEEGWTLLPNGKVLTVDCYTDFFFGLVPSYPANPTNSEIYDPETGEWSSAGSTIHTLTDPLLAEMGPALLRPDGNVFALGSSGNSAIYETRKRRWVSGPTLPISPEGYQYTAQDGPGALLPSTHVLVAASGGAADGSYSNPPLAFFEYDGHGFIAEPTIPNAAFDESGSISLLLLPTGQVLSVDGTNDVEIYTPDRKAGGDGDEEERSEWAPQITSAPRVVSPGGSYRLEGLRLNGMSQGSAYGDEDQDATNYPLVRITNVRTHHVFYSRTHDHSSMAVASERESSTHFDVPAAQEHGLSRLEVVANGVASEPALVYVK